MHRGPDGHQPAPGGREGGGGGGGAANAVWAKLALAVAEEAVNLVCNGVTSGAYINQWYILS